MKSKYFFPSEFRTNLAMQSELPKDMVRKFHDNYYVDIYHGYRKFYKSHDFHVHGIKTHAKVCKIVVDKDLDGWYHVTHLTLERVLYF